MKFIQLAVTSDPENGEVVYALSDGGEVYELTSIAYYPGKSYKGKEIAKGRASTTPFWRKVDLPFKEPALEDNQLRRLEFNKEDSV